MKWPLRLSGLARTRARVAKQDTVSDANDSRVVEGGALRSARMYAEMAHGFWTGKEAKMITDPYRRAGREEPESVAGWRVALGNSHMLSAIWTLVSAEVPSEIECPNCLAVIRAPYAEALKADPRPED